MLDRVGLESDDCFSLRDRIQGVYSSRKVGYTKRPWQRPLPNEQSKRLIYEDQIGLYT
jgi:hypothetical protein